MGHDAALPDPVRPDDPVDAFRAWFALAKASGIELPEAAALATATPLGVPSVRMVLLKKFDERGFVFFTNHGSRKAQELRHNPRAELCLHWASLERQIRIAGAVGRISDRESYDYFRSRPRGSRIGAWVSRQSSLLTDRKQLKREFAALKARFGDGAIGLPPHWGGYRLVPDEIEFWLGRPSRLHDRVRFIRSSSSPWPSSSPWRGERLYP